MEPIGMMTMTVFFSLRRRRFMVAATFLLFVTVLQILLHRSITMQSTTLAPLSFQFEIVTENAMRSESNVNAVSIPMKRSPPTPFQPKPMVPTPTTKIFTVVDYNYRDIAMKWYQRLTSLGYTSHVIVVADRKAEEFFAQQRDPSYRFERLTTSEGEQQQELPWTLQNGKKIWMLRWRYVRKQLELGNNVLLSDADNIFTSYVNLTEFEAFDAIHAFGTRWPFRIFNKQGFVICGCLSFLKANAKVIHFVDLFLERCGVSCDDQIVLNELINDVLHVEWNDNFASGPRTKHDIPLFNGLPTMGRKGVARKTGHSIMIWDRQFAMRAAPIGSETCPRNNWVSMPYYKNKTVEKMKWFDLWDTHCPPQNSLDLTDRKGKRANQKVGAVASEGQAAYQIAVRRLESRTSLTTPSFRNLVEQLLAETNGTIRNKIRNKFDNGSSPRVLNSIRIPKAGSSALSIKARALAGCHPDGFPCCKGRGDPPGSCPRPDLYCDFITGCAGHVPNFAGSEPVISSFRDPVSRLLSSFFYVHPHRPNPPNDTSWETFTSYLKSPMYRNVVTKMLSASYAYKGFKPERHTVKKAKARICSMEWFGMSDMPISSVLLLYDSPRFRQLIPNPVVFGLPPDNGSTQQNEEPLKEQTGHEEGLRTNDSSEYRRFRETIFVQNNGKELVLEQNKEDMELYSFSRELFCARLHRSGLVVDMTQAGIGSAEILQCSTLGLEGVERLCAE